MSGQASSDEPVASPSPVASPPEAPPASAQFRTFAGVFRPTTLTVLGAMLYLREGWLVGSLGLMGTLGVVVAAYIISGTTAMSVASIATNTRVRPGGAFAIISQAMGLEAGGAIGIPLYIAQAASTVLYLFAFSEAWAYLFPTHPSMAVAGVGFIGISALALMSAELAFKAQAWMLGVVVIALISGFGGLAIQPLHTPSLFRGTGDTTFLQAFAVFFPAATGVMVGVGMSGVLENPRKSIPNGTLAAWAVTGLVYASGAVYYSLIASPAELATNKTIMIDKALFGPLVLFGLMASTLMASLSSLVAAPQLLQAMARQGVLPIPALAATAKNGAPRNATIATIGVAAIALASGSLDAIAPWITSFFVLTYFSINAVVFVEQQLGMISWRPTFSIRPWVPLLGLGSTAFALALTSPGGGLLEIGFVASVYIWLHSRKLETPWETVRSGLGVSIVAWAARRWSSTKRSERAWRPDLLVPVRTSAEVNELGPLVEAITELNGSVKWVGTGDDQELVSSLDKAVKRLKLRNIYSTSALLRHATGPEAHLVAMEALQGAVFPPNLVLMEGTDRSQAELQTLVDSCRKEGLGLALLFRDPRNNAPPRPRSVQVWISARSPDWQLSMHQANLDLPVLLGYLLGQPESTELRLSTTVRSSTEQSDARNFLLQLVDQGRLPNETRRVAYSGDFTEVLTKAPEADLHLLGLPFIIDLERMKHLHQLTGTAALFLLDSGHESLLA